MFQYYCIAQEWWVATPKGFYLTRSHHNIEHNNLRKECKALYGWAADDGRPVCHTPKIPQNSHMTQLADCT